MQPVFLTPFSQLLEFCKKGKISDFKKSLQKSYDILRQ
jgi:hypothetical protein